MRSRRGEKAYYGGGEAAELIPFASWAQSSAVFPGQIKDLGLLATLLNYINPLVIYKWKDRSIHISYPISIFISKKVLISFIQRLIQRTALSPPAHEMALLQWMAEGP